LFTESDQEEELETSELPTETEERKPAAVKSRVMDQTGGGIGNKEEEAEKERELIQKLKESPVGEVLALGYNVKGVTSVGDGYAFVGDQSMDYTKTGWLKYALESVSKDWLDPEIKWKTGGEIYKAQPALPGCKGNVLRFSKTVRAGGTQYLNSDMVFDVEISEANKRKVIAMQAAFTNRKVSYPNQWSQWLKSADLAGIQFQF